MNNHARDEMRDILVTINDAYKLGGQALAAFDSHADPHDTAQKLEQLAAKYESGVVALRNYCERNQVHALVEGMNRQLPSLPLAGKAEMNEYGWLHISLNALLPHCRYTTPAYLTDTIRRLLDEYERAGKKLPRFDAAALVIDEHCDIKSRKVYDQDNKGYKAIPNALKGRVIKDDDQFSLHVHLTSTKSAALACHLYLLPQTEVGDFFSMRDGNYSVFP